MKTNPAIIESIGRAFQPVTIDRFATYHNKVCHQFNSYYIEQDACGIDAFSQNDYDQ